MHILVFFSPSVYDFPGQGTYYLVEDFGAQFSIAINLTYSCGDENLICGVAVLVSVYMYR